MQVKFIKKIIDHSFLMDSLVMVAGMIKDKFPQANLSFKTFSQNHTEHTLLIFPTEIQIQFDQHQGIFYQIKYKLSL